MSGFGKKKKKKGRKQTVAEKTRYNGIQFQSKLELYCYKALRKAKLEFEYEKTVYLLSEGFISDIPVWSTFRKIFKARNTSVQPITYKPDFTAKDGSWVIEVKGRKFQDFMLRWKLFLKEAQEEGNIQEIFMPTNQKEIDMVVKHLKEKNDGQIKT